MRPRSWSIAATFAALLLSGTAMAQAPAVDRQSALYGRPDGDDAAKLAPVPAPPLPTAADKLPVSKLHVPDGFKVEVYAAGVTNARSMTLGAKGTVFVGSRVAGKVHAITTVNGQRVVKVIASGLHRPNGVAFKNGSLFVAELSKIWRYDNIEDNLDNPPKPVLIYDDLPADEAHGWKFIAIGPDNKLYVPIGSPGNITMPPPTHAQIRRMNLDGTGVEKVAIGVRNSVGFDWNPVNGDFWFSNNGRDWVSEDIPNDTLHRVPKGTTRTMNFGFPYCHQGNFTDPEYGWGHSCDEFDKPSALMGPHVATLGMRFYTGAMFPGTYKNTIFLARHGSWNRSVKLGGDIVVVRLNPDGSVAGFKPFMTGFLENNKYNGRPVDVLQLKDGSMLVSDDFNGAVWRVSYGK